MSYLQDNRSWKEQLCNAAKMHSHTLPRGIVVVDKGQNNCLHFFRNGGFSYIRAREVILKARNPREIAFVVKQDCNFKPLVFPATIFDEY